MDDNSDNELTWQEKLIMDLETRLRDLEKRLSDFELSFQKYINGRT